MILISILSIYIYIYTYSPVYFKFVNMTLKSLNYCIYFIPIVLKKSEIYDNFKKKNHIERGWGLYFQTSFVTCANAQDFNF